MGIYRRSRTHKARKELSKKNRLRKRTKDLDQIVEDIETGRRQVEFDEDLPGGGQFQCVECSRFFIRQEVLEEHNKSKPHKKRLRELKTKPYTLEEANAAGGCGTNDFYLQNNLKRVQ
jgi:bud site selection protein 20